MGSDPDDRFRASRVIRPCCASACMSYINFSVISYTSPGSRLRGVMGASPNDARSADRTAPALLPIWESLYTLTQ